LLKHNDFSDSELPEVSEEDRMTEELASTPNKYLIQYVVFISNIFFQQIKMKFILSL
jgi:hypothetical protein